MFNLVYGTLNSQKCIWK